MDFALQRHCWLWAAALTLFVCVCARADPLLALDDEASTSEGVGIDIAVLANDTGDGLSVTALSAPDDGAASINPDGTVRYIPNEDFIGTDTFSYTVTNNASQTASATVTVDVGLPETITAVTSVDVFPQIAAPGDTVAVTVFIDSTASITSVTANDTPLSDQEFGVWGGDLPVEAALGVHPVHIEVIEAPDQLAAQDDSEAYTTARIVTCNNAALFADLMLVSRDTFLYRVCGRVTVDQPSERFRIDDGAGRQVQVYAPDVSVADGDLVAVRGEFGGFSEDGVAVVRASAGGVLKLD